MNATRDPIQVQVLTNSFHGTTYRTRKTRDEMDAIYGRVCRGIVGEADKAFFRKVRRVLCGIEGCVCGTTGYGER